MNRGLALLLPVVVLAACGSSGSSKPASAPQVSTTTVESAEARTWIAAAEKGLLADPSQGQSLTTADAACMSRALIDTITVDRLKAAGATLSDLSDPNKNLPPKLPSLLSPATKLAVGAAMQACPGFGRAIGGVFAQGFADQFNKGFQLDTPARNCITAWFQVPVRRALIAKMVLNVDPTSADSRDLASLILDCVGFGPLLAGALHVTLSPAENSCINVLARRDPGLVTGLANAMNGSGGTDSVFVSFGKRAVGCLTPAHISQIGKPTA